MPTLPDGPSTANGKIDARKYYDEMFFQRNHGLLEHILLMSVIKSYRFYSLLKTRLCPRILDGRMFRPDFTRPDFNQVYAIVAQFWESIGHALKDGEMGIGADLMDLTMANHVANGYMTAEAVHTIENTWLLNDIKTIEIAPDLITSLPSNPMFLKWLEARATAYEQQRLAPISLGHAPGLSDLQASVKAVQSSITTSANRWTFGSRLIDSTMEFNAPMKCSLPRVNEVLGGGFICRETSVVGAISGGGKTVLATQLAHDFVVQGINTMLITTEQPPEQLMMRMLSNHMDLDFAIFSKRLEAAAQASQSDSVTMSLVPEECIATPEKKEKLESFRQLLGRHLVCANWAGAGLTFEHDLDAQIDQITAASGGWSPRVVIVDWLGGGLEHTGANVDRLRLFYKNAAEAIINHGKQHNRCMIVMAQLNKTMVKPSTVNVTMDMLAECKSIVDNATNFLGITALREERPEVEMVRLKPIQYICADKARNGKGGKVRVLVQFHHQRFANPPKQIHGGDL